MAENNDTPWRLEVSAEQIAENLSACYVWFDGELLVTEAATLELSPAK